MIKFLWKDNSQEQLFDQMKAYVDRVVPEAISQEFVDSLKRRVDGLRTIAKNYSKTENLNDKGQRLNELLGAIDLFEPDFFDERAPAKVLAHFVAFGTLKLTGMRERYIFGPDYYEGKNERDRYLQELQEETGRYVDQAAKIRAHAIKQRLEKVTCVRTIDKENVNTPMCTGYIETTDTMCPSKFKQKAKGRRGGSTCTRAMEFEGKHREYPHRRDPHYQDPPDTMCVNRENAVKKGYGVDLDAILEPTTHWANLARKVDKFPEPARSDDPGRELVNTFRKVLATYSREALEACLNSLAALDDRAIDGCRRDAKRDKKTAQVDSVNDDEPAPGDADCDDKCARDVIAKVRRGSAEPPTGDADEQQ